MNGYFCLNALLMWGYDSGVNENSTRSLPSFLAWAMISSWLAMKVKPFCSASFLALSSFGLSWAGTRSGAARQKTAARKNKRICERFLCMDDLETESEKGHPSSLFHRTGVNKQVR